MSSATTLGTANPIVSTIEDILAAAILLLTVLAPILAGILVLLLAFFVYRALRRMRRRITRTASP